MVRTSFPPSRVFSVLSEFKGAVVGSGSLVFMDRES